MRIVSCTRAEAERQLWELADGWMHLDNWERYDEVTDAVACLRAGHDEVTAGHTTYRIQEADAA